MNGRYSLLSVWVFALMPAIILGEVATLNYQLGSHKIVGEAQNLKQFAARSTIHCGAICGSNQNCTLYSLCATPSTRFECTVYLSAELPELSKHPESPTGFNLMEVDSPIVKGSSVFLWRDSVGNHTVNLELSGVVDAQMCYEVCQTFTDGNCLLFSYSQSTDGKCVIPDCTDDRTWINGNDTRAFEVDNTAAVYFMDVPAFNTTAVVQAGFVIVNGTFSEAGESELGLPYLSFSGPSLNECLILCHIFSSNCSNHFRYTRDGLVDLCWIPPSDMSDLTYTPTHYSYVYVDKTITFDSSAWSTLPGVKTSTVQTPEADIEGQQIEEVEVCYQLCESLKDPCQTFSFNPGAKTCIVVDANFYDSWTYSEDDAGYSTYFLKEPAKWKLMSKHVAYQGANPHTSYTISGNQVKFATSSDIMPTFDSSNNQTTYLKNSLIDLWSSLSTSDKIRIELYMADGTFLKYIEHDASLGNSSDEWFSADMFISSSWSDLTGIDGSYYRWELVGEYGRTFHISSTPDNGCVHDNGWLAIQSTIDTGCVEWDLLDPTKQMPPKFIYSGSSDGVIWVDDMAEFDVLMIKMSFN